MRPLIPKIDICTLSENKEKDVMVSRFSDYLRQHSDLVAPHRHSFYHLLFFTQGAGKHTIDFHHFEIQPYQVYFMNPGQVHSWFFEGEVDGYVVNFSENFFTSFLLKQDYLDSFSFFRGEPKNSVLNLDTSVGKKTSDLFEELIVSLNRTSKFKEDLIRVLLLRIFIDLQNVLAVGNDGEDLMSGNPLLREYQKLIDLNFLDLRLPSEYASLLNITPNHLNALCKQQWGIQAGQLIRDRILLEAKRLLVNVDLSISEVAYRLNFNDNSYFSKFFRKEEGLTPEAFRKKHIQSHQGNKSDK